MPAPFDTQLRGSHGLLLGPDNYPLATPVARISPTGYVGGFAPPNRFWGWAGFPNLPEGLKTRVVIKIGAEIVASGEPTEDRPDIKHLPQPTGFHLRAMRALSHEEIAGGGLSAEAIAGPHRGPLHVQEFLATRSFDFLTLAMLSRAPGYDRHDVEALIRYAEAEDFAPGAKRKFLAQVALLNKSSRSRKLEEIAASALTGLREAAVIGGPASVTPLSDGDVASRFESLGQNSELGFIQRHFGQEPTSLLRWASIPYDLLMKGLQNRFSGVGDPTYTMLAPHWSDGEYATSDSRYDLTAHTFVTQIPKGQHDAEFALHCKRLSSLRAAFMESLQDSLRIYVRVDEKPLTAAEAHALFGELNKHGRNRLLIVRADRGRDGAVEALRPDLCVGYIRSITPGDAMDRNAQFDSWIGMLRNALTMFVN